MASLTVPIIVFIIGEAMSGGAMAMGISDHTAMLSKSIYAVISPEGVQVSYGRIRRTFSMQLMQWV